MLRNSRVAARCFSIRSEASYGVLGALAELDLITLIKKGTTIKH